MIINARGTGEVKGQQSMAFASVNSQIKAQFKDAQVYNVNYAAGITQQSDGGATDVSSQEEFSD